MTTKRSLLPTWIICSTALGLNPMAVPAAETFTDVNWTTLWPGLGGPVHALAVSGSNLFASGQFTNAGGSVVHNIAKWDGNIWSPLGMGMYNPVSALAVSGTDLYAGGGFSTATNTTANGIAKWDGSSWSALGSGMGGGVVTQSLYYPPQVLALAVSGSDLYAGGLFTTMTNSSGVAVTANNIAQWDGNSWSALGSGMGGGVVTQSRYYPPQVSALAVSGSDLYAGGRFVTATNSDGTAVTVNNIAKWDGSSWTTLGMGTDGTVVALAVSGTNLYVGGFFTTATNSGGVAITVNHIAKWDGSSWSALGSGINTNVYALAVSGSNVYAGGRFTQASSISANFISTWDGGDWSALGSGMDTNVYALAVSGNYLYAGGTFTTVGGKPANNIARAYLQTLPSLSLLYSGANVKVCWPSTNTDQFTLEQAGTPTDPASWVASSASVSDDGTNKSVTLPATNNPQFFRLHGP